MQGKTFSFNLKADGTNEQDTSSTATLTSTTGTLSITNGVESRLNNYIIYGKSIQDGTPSPTAPIDVVSLGEEGSIEVVTSSGKNLLATDITNIIQDSATASLPTIEIVDYDKILNGTIVTLSFDAMISNASDQIYVSASTTVGGGLTAQMIATSFIPASIWTRYSYTTTRTSSSIWRGIMFVHRTQNFPNNTGILYIKNVQLEIGSTATEYTPYETTYTIDLTDHEPLRCIGTVCDYIDYANGKIVRNIKKVMLIGAASESWFLYNNGTEGKSYARAFTGVKLGYQTSLSTHFTNINTAWGSSYSTTYAIYSDHHTILNKYFRAPNSSITTLVGFTDWLDSQNTAGTPLKVYYQLATPVDEPISLPSIKTYDVNTNITVSDGSMLPSKVDISYYTE